jgi:hypothetical protein
MKWCNPTNHPMLHGDGENAKAVLKEIELLHFKNDEQAAAALKAARYKDYIVTVKHDKG